MIAIHLKAKSDENGNPRRLFLVIYNEEIIDIVDEGYLGESVLKYRGYGEANIIFSIDIRGSEYKELLREAEVYHDRE